MAKQDPQGVAGNGQPRLTGFNILNEDFPAFLDVVAVLSGLTALILILGLVGLTEGRWIDPVAELLRRWFGYAAFLLPLLPAGLSVILLAHRQGSPIRLPWLQVIALEVALFCMLALLAMIDGLDLVRAESGYGGGIVGWGTARFLRDLLGSVGSVLALLALLLPSAALGVQPLIGLLVAGLREPAAPFSEPPARAESGPSREPPQRSSSEAVRRTRSVRNLPRAYRKQFRVEAYEDAAPARPMRRDTRLPPLTLLEAGKLAQVTAKEINLAAGLIEKTLADFGLPVRVVDFRSGPSVTQFAVEPGYLEHPGPDGEIRRSKVRVSQISALANDLALALSAPRLRIEAPVPGHAYVGIEVPNRKPAIVRLRAILETEVFQSVDSPLAIGLGRDVAGAPVAADLAAMPHLLIAGTTGSGKSVCIATLTVCLAMNNLPEDLRLVMIDPKMVELIRFNGLPHLIGKVETELDRIVGVLRWCTAEMDRRYRLLEAAKTRDIAAYNQRSRRRKRAEKLPRMVILIDELADLMMMAPDKTEQTLVRLAQMGRATGIHLVVATQRPSTDILTGLIKANFPARISFAVASGVDSRVILDTQGAETLLGRGDMLFLSPEASAPIRLQGAMVTDTEIERLIQFWQEEINEGDEEEAPWEEMLIRQAALEDRDEILEQAIDLVRRRGEASASMLQRALRIGYPRAARLMDELEELGVIGRPQSGGRTREVLIDRDEDPLTHAAQEQDEAEA